MALEPDPCRDLTCCRCRRVLDTRQFRYMFVLAAWRGRGGGSAPDDRRWVICGPCGQELEEDLTQFMLGGDMGMFRKGVVSCGRSIRQGSAR